MVPRCKAAEIILMGKPIDAQEAYRIGLVNKIVPLPELMPTARKWAEDICKAGPLAVRAAKEAMVRGASMTLEDGLRLENSLFAGLLETEDLDEGVAAFTEKRKPVFRAK
jgi:enoyl-CoA hydratase/carnithine racemase